MDLASAHEFISAVLHRSETVPVLVDFWAPWCGPCKLLKPTLEKLAAEAGGRWELVKVDTEALPVLAQQFGIRGIPDVKLFYRGNVVAQFSGALPEPQVRAWLEQNLPARNREALALAYAALAAGRWSVAEDQLATLRPSERTAEHTAALALARVFAIRPGRSPPSPTTTTRRPSGSARWPPCLRWTPGRCPSFPPGCPCSVGWPNCAPAACQKPCACSSLRWRKACATPTERRSGPSVSFSRCSVHATRSWRSSTRRTVGWPAPANRRRRPGGPREISWPPPGAGPCSPA